ISIENVIGSDLNDSLTGNNGANAIAAGAGNDAVQGAGGDDTLDGGAGTDTVSYTASAVGVTVDLSLTVGQNTAGAGIDTLTNFENVIGSGFGDTLSGDAAGNVLIGNAGDDTLNGGAGNDTLNGGGGIDTASYAGAVAGVTVNLLLAGAQNTVGAGVDTLIAIENVSGSDFDDSLTGNNGANILSGNGGADILNGGAGADSLIGGAGNDTYVVDNAGDLVTENLNEGTDTVNAGISYTLTANVENLTLTGVAAINGTGNADSNVITGNAAANLIDGGAGADSLIGGAGNDTYVVDNAGDVVTENAAEGTDTVNASISHTLAANVENLTLTGVAAINGTGNTQANVITGNAAANVLDGGAGADSLIGGAGNDTYVVDNVGDVVTENAAEGTDTVQSSITFSLAANVENLTLTGVAA